MLQFKNSFATTFAFSLWLFLSQSLVFGLQAQTLEIPTCDPPEQSTDTFKWGPYLIYVLPFAVGYFSAAALKPLDNKLKEKTSYTLIIGKTFFTWLTSTSLRAFFRPYSDMTEEAAKQLNAQTKDFFSSNTANIQRTDASIPNQHFSTTANNMNAKYSIRSQMARANVIRALLYVMQNIHQAREEIQNKNENIAAALLADAILYLRTAYAEVLPDNLEIADLAKNNLSHIISLPVNFNITILEKLRDLDPQINDASVQFYYSTILKTWGLSKADVLVVNSPPIKNQTNFTYHEPQSSWIASAPEMIIKYSPGLFLSLLLSVIEASPYGKTKAGVMTVKEIIGTCKIPFVTALSDPLNKYLESILQMWTFEQKNTAHVLTHGKVRDVSKSFDSIQEETYGHYTQNAQNGRANLARCLAVVADHASLSRRALQTNDESLAVTLLANAAYFLRIWHNEVSPKDIFVSNAVRARLSMHMQLGADFRHKIMEKLQEIDIDVQNTSGTKEYYETLLNSWQIGSGL